MMNSFTTLRRVEKDKSVFTGIKSSSVLVGSTLGRLIFSSKLLPKVQ